MLRKKSQNISPPILYAERNQGIDKNGEPDVRAFEIFSLLSMKL